jgi:hypothetical protein
MGAKHTLIGAAAPSPIRAPPAGPLDKVTGSTIQRDRLDPTRHRGAGALIQKGYQRIGPFELSIAILNHIRNSRLVLVSSGGHWPPFEKLGEWTAQFLACLQGATERARLQLAGDPYELRRIGFDIRHYIRLQPREAGTPAAV